MNKGKFVVFEGPEGSGKTTQISLAKTYLLAKGKSVKTFRDPGSPDQIGATMRQILKHGVPVHSDGTGGVEKLSPTGELLGFLAARAHLIEKYIQPALNGGVWVLCDRFAMSTLIYQGLIRHRNIGIVAMLNAHGSCGLAPDHYIVLSAPVEALLSRIPGRGDNNEFDLPENVRIGFSAYQRPGSWLSPGQPFTQIDAAGEIKEVHTSVVKVLDRLDHVH